MVNKNIQECALQSRSKAIMASLRPLTSHGRSRYLKGDYTTAEIRKSKRTFEKKLAGNIKSDSKSFYAYGRSKQKIRDKVGPLENNSGNIISDGLQMAEVLNEYFNSVFTTEDISSLPVPLTKFEGNQSEHLGQLFITPQNYSKEN